MKLIIILIFILISGQLLAKTAKQTAYMVHNRLTGIPPKKEVLEEMTRLIEQGNKEEAVKIAVNHRNFINIVIKQWVLPWSNREQSSRVHLNDYAATILGVVRDDIPFDRILYDDLLYTIEGSTPEYPYSPSSNDHYRAAMGLPFFIDLKVGLVQRKQSELSGISAPSGVITTRASGEAFFNAGTNRRVNRFTFINFLCKDYEDLHDTTIPDYRVRRDVERNVGNDSRIYKNKCVGCHAGQDALGGAYAYYNYTGNRLVYTPGSVMPKMNQNNYYQDGHVTVDDSWINLWVMGANAKLGWRGPSSGNGAKSLNQMIARSSAFSQCIAQKVFKLVCMKDAVNPADKEFVASQARSFENGYNLKNLIVKTTVGCVIDEE